VARGAQLLIDLLLLGPHAREGAEQMIADRLPVGGGQSSPCVEEGTGEQPAFIGAGNRQCLHQIVEAA
jgi:hypothetical protein